jgi:PAS domain S-box-containing protein
MAIWVTTLLGLGLKRAEEGLVRSEESFREMAENTDEVFWMMPISLDGILYVSPAYEVIWGRSCESLYKDPGSWLDAIVGGDREGVESAYKNIAAGEFHQEYRIMRPDGSARWIRNHAFPVKNEEGEVYRVVGFARDITPQKRAEQALMKSEEMLREAQDLAHLGHWEHDLATNRIFWSEETYHIYEMEHGQFGDTYDAFIDTIHPEDKGFVGKAYMDSVKNGTSYDIVHRLLMKDGSVKYVNERCKTEYDDDGRPLRSLGTVQDITERKRLEDNLLKAQKLESVGLLAGGIAHDFNNFLTGITGNISLARMLLESPGSGEKVPAILEKAEKATFMAHNLTKKLLTFSKGGAPIKKIVKLSRFLEDSATIALSGSNVRCSCDLPDDLCPVEVDEGQMGQVIQAIVLNAVHAMPGGGIIDGSARNVTLDKTDGAVSEGLLQEGNYVAISIRDHGTGIVPELLGKIFDPYFSTKKDGSGLGLATAHSIVEKHGGLITVESEVGVGSAFQIYLPTVCAEAPGAEGVRGAPGGPSRNVPLRVLVMDDEEAVREVAAEALSIAGYEATLSKDSDEAVGLYKEAMDKGAPFDAVILDLTIPGGMGGAETVKRLIAIDPEVKAVVSSGYSNDPVMADFEKHGFKGILAKPYRIDAVKEAILSAISNDSRP